MLGLNNWNPTDLGVKRHSAELTLKLWFVARAAASQSKGERTIPDIGVLTEFNQFESSIPCKHMPRAEPSSH